MKHDKHRAYYKSSFDIDISKENMGQVFEVICHQGNKFKVEVVDPRNKIVRITSKSNDHVQDYVIEGSIATSMGRPENLCPYAMLPSPPGIVPAIIIEKCRRL